MTETEKDGIEFVTFEITVPKAIKMSIGPKGRKETLALHPEKMHSSWHTALFMYGARRKPNDENSGIAAGDKIAAMKLSFEHMESGEEFTGRVNATSSGPKADTAEGLALRNAKSDLTVLFKKVTGVGKMIDMARHEKVELFFSIAGGKATWRDEVVTAWIAKQHADNRRDYVAEAREFLEESASAEFLIDL